MQERSWPKCAASAARWRHSQNNAFDAPDDRFLSAPRGGAITCFFLHLTVFPFCDRRHIQCPIPATWRHAAPDATMIIRCSRNAIGPRVGLVIKRAVFPSQSVFVAGCGCGRVTDKPRWIENRD